MMGHMITLLQRLVEKMTSQHVISVLYCAQRFGVRYSRFSGELLFQRLFSMFVSQARLKQNNRACAPEACFLFDLLCERFRPVPARSLPARGAFEISFYLALAD
jgi:hypothetical protein